MMYSIKMEGGENYGINYFHNFDVFAKLSPSSAQAPAPAGLSEL
jgi:hypothetical protein